MNTGVEPHDTTEVRQKKCGYAQRLEQIFQFTRRMNRLVLEEADQQEFAAKICCFLKKIEGYENSWLHFTDFKHETLHGSGCAESKLFTGTIPQGFPSLGELVEEFRQTGKKIICPFYGENQTEAQWEEATGKDKLPVFADISCLGKNYGTMIIILNSQMTEDEEQIHLIETLSEDIGLAFFHIETSEKRRKMEIALRDSEERYRSLIEHASDAVFLETFKGDIISVNESACKLLGYSREELLSMNASVFTPDGFEESMEELVEILKCRESILVETQNKKKTGEMIDVEVSISHHAIGGEDYALVMVRDITERRKSQQEIVKLNKELEHRVEQRTQELLQAKDELHKAEKLSILGQMAANIGHDLRNPLGAIKNSAYYLRKRHQDLDLKSIKHLDIMEKSIDYASNLIDELLNFSKQPQIKKEKINLIDLVGYILKTIHVPDSIEVVIPESTINVFVYGDKGKISRAILNILQNAFQAMPDGGLVEIVVRKAGKCGIVKIKDSGSGIKPEEIQKIFDPFFTTRTKGTGLGLAIAKRYIELNSGEITVESVPGKGSEFTVTLCQEKNEE
ncbi:MAG: PAS domain S-box protein [Firmicutes bacterium]|nr:PAS domain S-box protein [Bacillota bacterium]